MLSKFVRLTAALGVGAALYAGAAQAIVLDLDAGTSNPSNVTLVWQYNNVDGANLSASAAFILTNLTGTTATFTVNVANNTSGQPGDNRFVSFGIDNVTPNLTAAAINNAGSSNPVDWSATLDDTFPGFKKVELCIWAGQNCSGGSNSGLVEGAADSFVLTLTGNFGTTNPTIAFDAPFPSKWQAVGNTGKSWELAGCIQGTSCNPVPPVEIPEPGMLALFGLAFAGIGFARRRR